MLNSIKINKDYFCKKNQQMLKKNLLVLSSLIITFILIEFFLIFFFPQNLTGSFRTYGKNGLLLNVKNKTVPVYHLGRKITDYEFGEFHNRKYKLKKVKDKILILGDSFTFGWLLKNEDTFVYKLNENIANFSFINAAAGGWGTSDQLRYLMDYCNTIKPKYVIVFLNAFDYERSQVSNLFKIKNDKIIEGSNNISPLKKKLEKSKIYNFSIKNIHTFNILKEFYLTGKISLRNNVTILDNYRPSFFYNDIAGIAKHQFFYKKLFLKFKEEVKICNSKMIIVNLGWYDYNKPSTDKKRFFKEHIDFFNKNFNFLDLNNDLTEIHNNYSKYHLKGDMHPNKLANKYLYKAIYKKLSLLID